jgi:quercetin 2,3-dioxygenase
MIWVRRANARRHDRRHKRDVWRTFDLRDRAPAFADGFGMLETLDENRLPPGAEIPRYDHDAAEIVTYVREGTIACIDSTGHSSVIHAGEFERMTASRGVWHTETNASRADWAHVFQIRLHGSHPEHELAREQKRFSTAERRGVLRVVASPDLRTGSLRLHEDTRVYSAILEPGQHVVHELAPGRAAWLHVVLGEVVLRDLMLTAGDGVGLAAERAVSLTARQGSEILLFDLASIIEPDLESRINARCVALVRKLEQLEAATRGNVAEARDKLNATLSELERIIQERLGDGWASLGDQVRIELEHWLAGSASHLEVSTKDRLS